MSTDQPLTKKPAAVALVLPDLEPRQLDAVRMLAQEGCREHVIRRALELTPRQWKALKENDDDGELSRLALALEEGRAEGAGEVISFMKRKMMDEGSERAAEWLAANIFQINKGDGNTEAPRVLIQINAALSPEEYGRVVNVQTSQGLAPE